MVKIPYEQPSGEPFQAQTQRGYRAASRGGVETARYKRRGLLGPAEKQIGWHHGEAAFVLKFKNEEPLKKTEVPFYVFYLGRTEQIHRPRGAQRVL